MPMEAINELKSNPLPETASCGAPTIRELLADPMTQAVMKADHVDVGAVEKMLRAQATRLRGREKREAIADYNRWGDVEFGRSFAPAPSVHGSIAARVAHSPLGWLCTW
jgi:hypothetical protein